MYASFLNLPIEGRHSRALHLELFTVPSRLTTFYERVKHGWSKIHHLIDKRGYTPYTSAHIKRVLAITEGANLRSLIYLMPRVRRFEGIEGVSERGKNSMRERNGCFSARIA